MGHITSNSCNNKSKSSDDFCCNDLNNCEIQELKNVDTANLQEGDILIASANGEFYNTPLCETPCINELRELIEAQTDDQVASEVSTDPTNYTILSGGDVQTNLDEIDLNLQDLINRITDEENKLTVVSVQDVVGTNDILVTYSDGSSETIDKPEFSASTDGAGLVTFDLNGTLFGPFDTGMHTVDTDTYGAVVSNGDGTATITFPDGTTATVSEGPHTVDTDTFASWSDNGDGTITVTFADGTTQIVPQGAHTVDTDTFSTIVDNGDGTVTVTYASGATATFATGPHTVDTDTTYTFIANADGSITVNGSDGSTFTGPANTVDTDTFATLSGTTITFANGDTLDVASFDTNVSAVNATVAASGITISVVEDGTTISAPQIPFEQTLSCNPASTTSIVTPNYMNNYVERGINFDSDPINAHTNLCSNTVQSSVLSTADGPRASAIASNQSAANGTYSVSVATSFGQANGNNSGLYSVSGTTATPMLLNAQSAFGLGVRSTAGPNGVAQIDNGWSGGVATLNPRIGIGGPDSLYSVILGGADNQADFNYSTVLGSIRSHANEVRANITSSTDSENAGPSSVMLASQEVVNTEQHVVVGGFGNTGTPSTANRTWKIESITGDFYGNTFNGGLPIPGAGEEKLFEAPAKEGEAVVLDGAYGARLAKEGEKPDGVTTKTLAVNFGGGFDPENLPFELDAMGNRVMEEVEIIEEFDVIDVKATENPKEGEKPDVVTNKEKRKVKVKKPKRNPNFDAEKHEKLRESGRIIGIEMIGTQYMNVSESFEVGDYIGAEGKVVDSSLGFRVLEVVDGKTAIVLVK